MLSRLKIVDALVNEGFSHKTLSLFSDSQINALGKKLLSEKAQSEIMYAQAALQSRAEKLKDAFDSGMASVQAGQEALSKQVASESSDIENDEDVKTVDTDNMGNPDVDIKKPNKKTEKLINDKKDVEEDVTSEMVENWMTQVVNKKEKPLSKAKLIEMVKNIQEDDIGGMTSDPEIMRREYGDRKNKKHAPGKVRYGDNPKPRTKLFSSVEQEYAFEQLNKYVLDLDGYQIMVDELEYGEDPEEAILNLFLASEAGFTWDIIIYTDGNIYMDGAPIQDSQDLEEEIREKESGGENWIEVDDDRPDNWRELPGYNPDYFYGEDSLFGKEKELAETERDTEGAYMGAPVGTEMPVKTPVRTPTTTPTTPKRRRGPFTRPSVKPKPKAGKEDMPDWMGFDDIKAQTENS
jgi:hypothetical protein